MPIAVLVFFSVQTPHDTVMTLVLSLDLHGNFAQIAFRAHRTQRDLAEAGTQPTHELASDCAQFCVHAQKQEVQKHPVCRATPMQAGALSC